MLSTISKSGRVLALFTAYQFDWGVTEVAGSLGISKSAAHSQLSALAEIGFLRRTKHNRYQLGWRLVSLSQVLLTGTGLQTENRRLLHLLARRGGPGCAAYLLVLDGSEVLCIDGASYARADLGPSAAIRFSPTTSAGGKMLLATLPREQVEAAISPADRGAAAADMAVDGELAAELARVRVADAAWDRSQSFPGLTSVAAPVREREGTVVAAVSVSGPESRFERQARTWERAVRGVGRSFLRSSDSPEFVDRGRADIENRGRTALCSSLGPSGTN
jgi:DNA-binding IclR family transcriptional regulator